MTLNITPLKPIILALAIALSIAGVSDHLALQKAQAKADLYQKRYQNLTTSLQKALNANNASQTKLKQNASTEQDLKSQIQDLQTKLQAKLDEQNRIAQASVGYGGLVSAPQVFSNGYAFGNCTFFVASLVHIPDDWGNANNWANAARSEGYTVSDVPRVGSIAQTSAGYFGHVALVESIGDGTVTVKEMNVEGLDVIDEQSYPTSSFVYIYV